MKLKCEHCRWWEAVGISESWGQCHLNPPTIDAAGQGTWPLTRCTSWCGKFETRDDRAARLLGTKYMAGETGEAA
jgi:hypothetical protein